MTATDVPAILRHRRAWAGLVSALARHPGQVAAAIALLPRLSGYEVEQVVRFWDPDRFTRTEADAPAPPVPQELFDAVLEACLAPLAAFLLHPEPEKGWEAVSDFSTDWSLDLTGHSGGWEMLARCPERWAELAAHPTLGAAVQHLLLDQAGTQALKDARLRAADPDSEGVSLLPQVRRTYAPRGRTPLLRHRLNWKRASMAAALGYHAADPDRGPRLCFHLKPGSYDTTALIEVLEQMKAFYRGERVVLVWDWSRAMRAWVAEQDWLALERLPAYAPELNPVELLWSSLKRRELANLAGDHLAEVADATEQSIYQINHNPPAPLVLPRPHRPDHPPTNPTQLTKRSVGAAAAGGRAHSASSPAAVSLKPQPSR
ncbi:transposase [Streptomyces sp. NRRL F-5193]|uniref:transposase n=1 Tax=Streptomyces sp. NRRL F-5193 TaxID=1463860 RepID=UPI000B13EE18|nr:transposase [Streptomyces sp. NRRL F-5193]